MPKYLSRYIGAGTDAEPFRPRGSDQLGWSAIDLRPDGGATLGGGGLNACLLDLPVADPDRQLIELGDDGREPLRPALRTAINSLLRLSLPSGLTLREGVARMLTAPPANGWKPIQPTREGRYEIWLGGLLWSARTLRGGATFTDDFNRADNADLGASWAPSATDVDRHCIIAGNAAAPSAASQPCYESVTSISPGGAQYATITMGALTVSVAQSGQAGATIRATIGVNRNFYQAYGDVSLAGTTTALAKRVAGSGTTLQSENATTWVTGNTLKLSGSGSTLTVQRNGAGSLLSTTDTAHTAGNVGIFLFRDGSGDSVTIDAFDGGDIATATVVPQAAYHYAMHRGA